MFARNRSVTFLHPKRDLNAIYSTATQAAGRGGTDCLDLLTAALGTPTVATLIKRLGVDAAVLATSVSEARDLRQPGSGLTEDAKRVVEAVSGRALERRRDPSAVDLLVALATADTAARGVLNGLGIDEAGIRALVE